ncbi:MAG: hypothetical protein ACE5HZ_04645 [Fidelibacterota bacterium]
MPDINLFDQPGFQEAPARKEKDTETRPEKRKKSRRKKKRFSPDEIIAAVVLIGIGAMVVWYLSLRWTVKSEVEELTPEEFLMGQEEPTGI